MKPKITLKQIAKDLGLSVSTVSKALSDSHEIGTLTKNRVQEYAKLQNYKPNSIAKNLKNQRTNTIGVIIPNILNPFFAKVFSGIEKVCDEKGYKVITCISNESLEKEINALEMLSNGTIDGFILSISEETQKENYFQHFTDIINDGIPIVMFAFDYDHKIIYCLGAFTPTGHYQHDLKQIMQRYVGHFSPKNPHWLAEPLQNLVKNN